MMMQTYNKHSLPLNTQLLIFLFSGRLFHAHVCVGVTFS